MSGEKKLRCTGNVFCVYLVYWLAFGLFLGSLACTRIAGALSFYLSFLVGVTFLFVYDCKDRIKASPLRCMAAFLLFAAITLVPFKFVFDFYFTYILIVALCCMSVIFAYTFFLRERISRSPWKYLMVFILVFLFITVAITALPIP